MPWAPALSVAKLHLYVHRPLAKANGSVLQGQLRMAGIERFSDDERQALVWRAFGEESRIQILVQREGRALHTSSATEG